MRNSSFPLLPTGLLGACLLMALVPPAVAQSNASESPMLTGNEFSSAEVWPESSTGWTTPHWTASAELLYLRPHFSEAVAFAKGRQGAGSYDIAGRSLKFGYDSSLRASVGRAFGDAELRFTYGYFQGQTGESGQAAPGRFFVDPFGNVAGTVVVLDPSDARFGTPITGGDAILGMASAQTNLFDLEFAYTLPVNCCWDLQLSAGLRMATVEQTYDSEITSAGAFFSGGRYTSDYWGGGPILGLRVERWWGSTWRGGLYLDMSGSLLLGESEVTSTVVNTVPGPFQATQANGNTRTVPVWETEVGGRLQLTHHLSISAAWMIHVWGDMGASGGSFGGFFGGADDANLMAFDAAVARLELTF